MRGLILVLLLGNLFGCGVPKATMTVSQNSDELYKQGVAAIRSGDLDEARTSFDRCLVGDSTYTLAHLGLAEIAFQKEDLVRTNLHLDKLLTSRTHKSHPQGLYLKGLTAWKQTNFKVAKESFELYLEQTTSDQDQKEVAKYIRDSDFMLAIKDTTYSFAKCTLPGINTPAPEYLPTVPAHEEFMIFTRRLAGQEDLYVSTAIDSAWSKAMPLLDINTPENEGAHTISADGNTLVFTRCGARDGLGSCDLYFSTMREGRWSEPRNLGPEINGASWDAQPSFSPTMHRLYFASDRPGGKGGRDIWYVDRTLEGWSAAKNLSAVNTAYNDESPHLHSDGQHFYFMSEGHPGFGGYDLFVSSYPSGEIINLGPTINTPNDEGSMHVMRDGITGYYARSIVEGRRLVDSDICQVLLPEIARARPTAFIDVQVFDQSSGAPIDASVRITDSVYNTTGRYPALANQRNIYTLPTGSSYSLQIDRPGYSFSSRRFQLGAAEAQSTPLLLHVSIQPLPDSVHEVMPVLLENVFFVSGSADLLSASSAELDFLTRKMLDEPHIALEISGHTDDVGDDAANQLLSEERARSVYDYLLKKGISANRLTYIGYGESRPIATNETAAGKAKNRRTEIKIFNR